LFEIQYIKTLSLHTALGRNYASGDITLQ